ncbi:MULTISPECIES: cytochrome P450 [Nocardiaceae]|uniref:Cytochrome P450 FAS1 n=3 Tax=Rhodococcoides fascians TaxID=1828 RepID=FAS1_RHOFA|nr:MULTISPECIES: cytochrome P450 [Rhodococcus]P46373.1 RecName: Full=Cytochrome P450 FAS1 [Rhodococcus fascians]AET25213.1 putative cytochrome P450 monooxygenase [Rhodococcus fascians D188]AMY56240.1 Cytochrome P450 FAS1 [Rhodococcus fascians D188]OZC51344.1 cytochrome P450 FAS1 [Rhodococcus sp. 06-621-2]OZC60763.1 cytochrome P450 FAS1 [Rhodococcus sp. 06-469-3-2]OZC65305.1 cytochrome P450 FAS1 [Rhodococcus sp. 06-462-5]
MAGTADLPLEMRRNGLNPTEELAQVRDRDGVIPVGELYGAPAFLVCRYEDVRRIFADSNRFSNAHTPMFAIPSGGDVIEDELAAMRAGNLIGLDPPDHTRLRHILAAEFSVHRLSRLQPRIAEIVDSALDGLEQAGQPADLMDRYALPVSLLVLCELLGVPYADRDELRDRTARLLDLSASAEQRAVAQREDRRYMATLVTRAQEQPGDDLLGILARKIGDNLSTDELISIISLIMLGGHETTASMIGLSVLALLHHPEQAAMMIEDPNCVNSGIEELLRWLSVAHSQPPRMAVTEVQIAGVTIPAGSFVIPSLLAANRDSNLTDRPDDLDITRGVAGHLAFGHGVHFCLGHSLARMTLRTAVPAVLRRFPDLALSPSHDVRLRSASIVLGLEELQLTW